VAARLEAQGRRQVAPLSSGMKDKELSRLPEFAQGLSAVAARLEPKDAAQVAAQAGPPPQAMKTRSQTPRHWRRVCRRWAPLGPGARRPHGRPRAILIQGIGRHKNVSHRQFPVAGSVRVAPHGGQEAATTLNQAMKDTQNAHGLSQSWRGVVSGGMAAAWSLTPRMPAQSCGHRSPGMKGSQNGYALSRWCSPDGGAPRLEPKDAAQVAATLLQAIKDNNTLRPCESWRRVLSAGCSPGGQSCRQAAASLISHEGTPRTQMTLAELARGPVGSSGPNGGKTLHYAHHAARRITWSIGPEITPKGSHRRLPLAAQGCHGGGPHMQGPEAATILIQAMKGHQYQRGHHNKARAR